MTELRITIKLSKMRFSHVESHEVDISDISDSKVTERLNGEVRDREKVVRGLKNIDINVLPGYQPYHNFIRPREGIGNMTPAEKCSINIEGENKWVTLIQNAKKNERNG